MDSKERVKTTLNHQEPDRIPLDIGGSRVTGIHIKAYQTFRSFYRLPPSRPEILVFYLQLAKIDEDFRSLLKVDMESINPEFHAEDGNLQTPENGGSYYRDLIKPRHTALFKFIKERSHGKAYLELHSCGAIREIIPDIIESGVEILNPVQVSADKMETAELKKEFGKALVFHGGGIDSQYTLPYGKVSEVRDEVKRRIDDLAPGGGFIFTPVHSIQKGVPPENLAAMLETFYQYAIY